MSMRIISPGRLFALMCLLAAWTGLEGARTPTSAQVPLVCAISDGNLDFKTIPVSNNIPSAAIAPGFLTINCPSAPPNSTVWVCVKAQTLPMGTLPRAVALLYYDVAAVNKQVSTNGGKVPIEGTISKNQQKIPADSYVGNVFMSNVTYSATNCLTAANDRHSATWILRLGCRSKLMLRRHEPPRFREHQQSGRRANRTTTISQFVATITLNIPWRSAAETATLPIPSSAR